MGTNLTVKEAIESRRSIRKYTEEPMSEAEAKEILQLAGLAPSPWNLQPWRVKVIQTQEGKDALKAAAYGQPQVGAAASVFVITSDMEDMLANIRETVHPGYGDKIDATAADMRKMFEAKTVEERTSWGYSYSFIFVGFLLLALQSKGWATSTMAGFDAAKVRELYGLPETTSVVALVAAGRPADEGFPHHRHAVDRFVSFG